MMVNMTKCSVCICVCMRMCVCVCVCVCACVQWMGNMTKCHMCVCLLVGKGMGCKMDEKYDKMQYVCVCECVCACLCVSVRVCAYYWGRGREGVSNRWKIWQNAVWVGVGGNHNKFFSASWGWHPKGGWKFQHLQSWFLSGVDEKEVKDRSNCTLRRSSARRSTLLAKVNSSFLWGFCSICRYRLICR